MLILLEYLKTKTYTMFDIISSARKHIFRIIQHIQFILLIKKNVI